MLMIFKALLPLFASFLMGMFKAHQEAKAQQQELLFRNLKVKEKSRRRAGNIKDKNISWTRRTLALMFSTTLLGIMSTLILAGLFNHDIVLNVPQETLKHSFLSFIGIGSPNVVDGYIQLKGATLVVPFVDTLILITESICGFYFGSATSKR